MQRPAIRSIVVTFLLGGFCAVASYPVTQPALVLAQTAHSQSGEIDLDLSEEDAAESYSSIQDRTIKAFEELRALSSTLAQSGSGSTPVLDDKMISYLTAVYLYCAVQSGTCAPVLEAVLEVDVINSRLRGTASCPTMKRFWKAWVDSDMEERHKFQVKTSHINAYTKFNTETRPRFLRCEDSIKEILQGTPTGKAFFSARYRAGSPEAKLFPTMVALLKQLKEKVPNLFVATGSQPTSEAGAPKKRAAPAQNRQRKP